MAVLLYSLLLLALAAHSSATYCICKGGIGDQALQKALDYACGAGADCGPINQNGPCFQPNTVQDHCSYAVNSYFQKKGQVQGSCDFSGAATPSQTLPTTGASACVYPSSPGTTGTPTTGTPTTGTPTAGTPTTGTPTTTTPSTTPTTTTPSTTTPSTTTPSTTTPITTTPTTTTTPSSVYGAGISPTGSGTTFDGSGGVSLTHRGTKLSFSTALILCFSGLFMWV